MPTFGEKNWDNDLSVIRGRRSLYYQQFNNMAEILLDCVAHERPDSKSIQCIVDLQMQQWRNPFTAQEATALAQEYLISTKANSAHWASWISPTLLTYSPKTLTPRPIRQHTSPWRVDIIKEEYDTQPWSALLSLPAELRIEILTYAILPDPNTTPFFPSKKNPNHIQGRLAGTPASLQPHIARSCRQLRSETLPLFYSENIWIFPCDTFQSLRHSQLWLATLTDKFVSQFQHIILLGFNRKPLPLPQGLFLVPPTITNRLGRGHDYGTVRIGINLRNLKWDLETEVPKGGEWLVKWEGVMGKLREVMGGWEMGEWILKELVGEFGRGCEDVERRGRRVEWMA